MDDHFIRVAVVDDHPLMRDGVAAGLALQGDITVVAAAKSIDAFKIAAEFQPSVMLIGVNEPGGGLAVARQIATAFPDIRLLFLTISERHEDARAALECGVSGYVLKDIERRDLLNVVRTISGGGTYISPDLAIRLLVMPARTATRRWGIGIASRDLSTREEQILDGVAQGLTNKEIANSMDLSERTVKHHMTGVMRKLNVRNRVEAFLLLRRSAFEATDCYPN